MISIPLVAYMFRTVSLTTFESDEGFRMETRRANQVIYSRQGHVLKVEGELMTKPSGFFEISHRVRSWLSIAKIHFP